MKKKYLVYALVPAFAVALAVGGAALARGMFGFGMSNLTPEQIASNQNNMFQREANLLGVSVDEVKNAWAAGKTFQQLATEKGITAAQLQQKMIDQRKQDVKNYLSTLVSQGVITQAQADQRSQFIDQMSSSTSKFRRVGPKTFGRHGMGMGMGMGFGF
jgi:hypothetical protein